LARGKTFARGGAEAWRDRADLLPLEAGVRRASDGPGEAAIGSREGERQTELAEQFPSHVVCAWLGNSEDIARKHSYQVTDDYFAQATAAGVRTPPRAPSTATLATPVSARDEEPEGDAQSVALTTHNPTQQPAAADCTELHDSTPLVTAEAILQIHPALCQILQECGNGWGGILPARIHHPAGFMGFALQPHWQHGFTCVWKRAARTGQRRFSADILSTLLARAIFRNAENGRMIRTIRHTLPCPAIAGAAGGAA
jgi:hypothetical protein